MTFLNFFDRPLKQCFGFFPVAVEDEEDDEEGEEGEEEQQQYH